jgi:hypothetical protein
MIVMLNNIYCSIYVAKTYLLQKRKGLCLLSCTSQQFSHMEDNGFVFSVYNYSESNIILAFLMYWITNVEKLRLLHDSYANYDYCVAVTHNYVKNFVVMRNCIVIFRNYGSQLRVTASQLDRNRTCSGGAGGGGISAPPPLSLFQNPGFATEHMGGDKWLHLVEYH